MIKTINFSDFCDEWNKWEDRKDRFTYNGKRALFDYLEELEDSTGEQMELDIIALCCEYTEYATADEAASEYFDYEGMEYDEDGDETLTADEVEAKALKYLEDHTTVITFDGGIIIANF